MSANNRINRYRQASFLLSVNELHQLPPDDGAEVAFAGRSNAGKSSALNTLCEQKSLARTSKTPGRTQMINVFTIDDDHRLTDLPGYGYAKVPEKVKRHWVATLEAYLQSRECLKGLILLMDVRHPLTEFDRTMLDWCHQAGMSVHVLLTKADKLKRGPAKNALLAVRRELKAEYPEASVQLFSALKRDGVAEALTVLDRWMGFETNPHD